MWTCPAGRPAERVPAAGAPPCRSVLVDLVDPSQYLRQYPSAIKPRLGEFDLPGIRQLLSEVDLIGISSYAGACGGGAAALLAAASALCTAGAGACRCACSLAPSWHACQHPRRRLPPDARTCPPAAIPVNFTLADLENAIWQFDQEISHFGVDLKKLLHEEGKLLILSEYGLGA